MSLASYLLTFTEGILTFISPCILPMLPIYFLYLGGATENESIAGSQAKNRMLVNSLGFVTGFTLVFLALGITVTSLGHFLQLHRDLLRQVSGLLMVVFGLNFMGIIKLNFLNMEKRFEFKFNNLQFLSSVVFGMVFGFGWTPCLGAFLGSALLLASSSQTIFEGALLLFLYSIGLGIPFILTSLVFERVSGGFRRLQKHTRLINIISGILLIAAGILVFTGSLRYLNF